MVKIFPSGVIGNTQDFDSCISGSSPDWETFGGLEKITYICRMIGIYKITSPSGKVYIGQSWNISKRFNRYKYCNKNQRYLYNSFLKYGFENHNFEIVIILPIDISQEILNNYENIYWKAYKEAGFEMLNCKEPGMGGELCDETKKLISESKKQCITQFNLEGKVLNYWISIKDASEKLSISSSAISSVVRGDYQQVRGFIFRKGTIKKDININVTRKPHKKENLFVKKVGQYDLSGNLIKEWCSQSDAARHLGKGRNSISKSVLTGRKSHDFFWKNI